jgi:hypothetical protein
VGEVTVLDPFVDQLTTVTDVTHVVKDSARRTALETARAAWKSDPRE